MLQRVNVGRTDYDALELHVDKRFSGNYSAKVSYTLSYSRGNMSGNGIPQLPMQVLDDLGLDANEGPTDFDRRHNLVVSGTALLNPWGVVNAVERGDAREALRQIRIVTDAGEVPFMTLGQIGWWVRNKLPQMGSPDRVRAAVDAVFRTDLAIKSSGGEPRILLERLVVQLCGRSTQSRPRAAP